MATQQNFVFTAVCDRCGAPNDELWPGFEFEDEAEEMAIEECDWQRINGEIVCPQCE